ncbi:MAG: DUF4124 domain-containing protein [Gammaproteobacteria bacterium]|jgi:hypothetical protein|nr:DUF4124 domain-containing protein [Gammaproteobacteria bacterium]
MSRYCIHSSALLLALQVSCVCADTIYRWIDRQGQVHFSDSAPDSAIVASEIQPPDSPRNIGSGLRSSEIELLQQIQQRSQQQAQQAQARRLKSARERAEQRERCHDNRKKLQGSRGHDTYKQYSRYLRKHCW